MRRVMIVDYMDQDMELKTGERQPAKPIGDAWCPELRWSVDRHAAQSGVIQLPDTT